MPGNEKNCFPGFPPGCVKSSAVQLQIMAGLQILDIKSIKMVLLNVVENGLVNAVF